MKKELLKKIRNGVCLLTAGASIVSFAGCGETKFKDEFESITSVQEECITEDNKEEVADNVVTYPTMDENTLIEYLNYFDEQLSYNYEDYYISEEEVKNNIEVSLSMQECDFIYDGNEYALLNKIIEKSNEYAKNNGLISPFPSTFSDGTQLSEQEEMFYEALLNVLSEWEEDSSNNISEDACRAQDLKIVIGDCKEKDTLGTYDSNKNLITIYLNNIKHSVEESEEQKDLMKEIQSVIKHEFNHMRQKPCECRIKKGQKYSFLKCSNKDIGAMLIESSAESAIYNEKSNFDYKNANYYGGYTYSAERKNESMLMLLNLFDENSNIQNYYNAIFDTDLNAFYEYFGATSDSEIYDLYKIIYSMDSICTQNNLAFDITSKEVLSYNEISSVVGYSYKVNLFKKILKDMVSYTNNHKDFDLEQNLVMFDYIKNVIVDDISNLSDQKDENGNYIRIYDEKLVTEIVDAEQKYIEFLSQYYGKSVYAIRELENSAVLYTMRDLFEYFNGNQPYYNTNYTSLLKRFPQLEALCFAMPMYTFNYEGFLEDNGISYSYTMPSTISY